MTSSALYPAFFRPNNNRVVGGVASGLAVHLRVNVLLIRIIFLLAAVVGGAGIWFYGIMWMFTKTATDAQNAQAVEVYKQIQQTSSTSKNVPVASRTTNFVLVGLAFAGAIMSISFFTGFRGANLISGVVIAVGALLLWRAYDQGLESIATPKNALGIGLGTLLVLSGVFFVTVNWTSPALFGASLAAVLLTLAGAAILAVPLLMRMWQRLNEERDEKTAAAERAEIASKLHDSVLQTLALIQKRAGDEHEVARLARGQERELRQWLFGTQDNLSGGAATVFKTIELACGEVEDMFGIRIAPIVVGEDCALDDTSQAAVLAAREAMVNAAKHSGQPSADVYAEVLAGQLDIFVRDRGEGFDPSDVDPSRHGLAESVHGRVERAGGKVKVKTAPGSGTEVHISMPLESAV